jgi:hypothetical protein
MLDDRFRMLIRGFCGQLSGLAAVLAATVFLAFAFVNSPTEAQAASGGYVFDGGSAREQATVRSALAASAFDWNLVPGRVTIHITRAGGCASSKGQIWLDSATLSTGRASWGVIQHGYAHQVDFFLFNRAIRTSLNAALHGRSWWPGRRYLGHSQYGAERFASTLAWAYWPSRHNALIRHARAEATAMPPARFRRLLDRLLSHR